MAAPLTPEQIAELRAKHMLAARAREIADSHDLLTAEVAKLRQAVADMATGVAGQLANAQSDLEARRAAFDAMMVDRDAARAEVAKLREAYARWNAAVNNGPGSGIDDPDYPGPSDAECDEHDREVGAAWDALIEELDAIAGSSPEGGNDAD